MASSCSPLWLSRMKGSGNYVGIYTIRYAPADSPSGSCPWILSCAGCWHLDIRALWVHSPTAAASADPSSPAGTYTHTPTPPHSQIHTHRASLQQLALNTQFNQCCSLDRLVSQLPHTQSHTHVNSSPWELASSTYCSGPAMPTSLYQRITYFCYSSSASHLEMLLLYILISSISVTKCFTKSRINMTHT